VIVLLYIIYSHWILSIISHLSHCLTTDGPNTYVYPKNYFIILSTYLYSSIYILDSLSSGGASVANDIAVALKAWINHVTMDHKNIEVKSDIRVITCQVSPLY
jgi:hypothetical protein